MTRFLLAGAAALGMMTATAMAQNGSMSSSSETTTTTTVPSAPVITTTTKTTGHATRVDGDRTATAAVGYKDSAGDATKETITNTTYPLTNQITTVKKTRQTVNGVTTETVQTTQTYPHVVGRPDTPPLVTTETHVVSGTN